jgi:hypothetical protein
VIEIAANVMLCLTGALPGHALTLGAELNRAACPARSPAAIIAADLAGAGCGARNRLAVLVRIVFLVVSFPSPPVPPTFFGLDTLAGMRHAPGAAQGKSNQRTGIVATRCRCGNSGEGIEDMLAQLILPSVQW